MNTPWPSARSTTVDPALETRVHQIRAGMSLRQKVGQMTQAEIRSITPEEVRRYYIGSVLNGGGGRPGNNKYASVGDWLALAQAFHQASMSTDMAVPVPVIWGTDAVHGHNNVHGATVFPHNIGLGATRDAALVREIGTATAKGVRATGLQWVFAPTLAVAQDARWGRTYESFSQDPELVRQLGQAAVAGLQGTLGSDASVLATAKHYIGDGGTEWGRDQGVNRATQAEMIQVHAAGYYGALDASVQTVMVSLSSWHETLPGQAAGRDHGKLHGSHHLITEVLKQRLGFDGLVVTDWNGVGQVLGCTNTRCAAAINAGIDMVMVPEQWREFITHTIDLVERGEIPMARIDDAVSRILRVKLRAGLFEQSPAQNAHAGHAEALLARDLARRAARQSQVLLKNHQGLLPLARNARVLVVGKSADSLQNQTGGWTLTWQGNNNLNSDFVAGDTVLGALRQALGDAQVVHSPDGSAIDQGRFDAVVAVIGETPYAEGVGDISPSGNLMHSQRHPEDLAVLQKVAGHGVPVVTVFMSGRPLYTHDLINLSDAFVASWLPGTEGAGVVDVLLRAAPGQAAHDFSGRLPFEWPGTACPKVPGAPAQAPLFKLGHGLRHGQPGELPPLPVQTQAGPCTPAAEVPVFERVAAAPYSLELGSLDDSWPSLNLGHDLESVIDQPAVQVSTVQIHTQQDAKRVQWRGPAQLYAASMQRVKLSSYAHAALVFDTVVSLAPQAPVVLALADDGEKLFELDLTTTLRALPLGQRKTIKVPLVCFAAKGADLDRVTMPFSITTTAPFTAAFARIRVVAGAAKDADALSCAQLQPL